MEEKDLRILFSSIIRGFSLVESSDFGPIYIKHLNIIDISNIDDNYNLHLNEAIKTNAPTKKQQEEYLSKESLWAEKEEREVKENRDLLGILEINLSKEYLKSRRIQWNRDIDSCKKKLNELESKKLSLIGPTAESYATKKSNEEYIRKSFFKDEKLTEHLFSGAEFDELDERQVYNLNGIYNRHAESFNGENLKKLAISTFFLNLFYLSADNPRDFYGIPVVYLTFYQSQVFSFGRYFKNVLAEHGDSIPKSVMANTDELMEWVEIKKNFKDINKDGEDDGASYVGASRTDLEYLGLNPQAGISLSDELKKNKGKLNMAELMKLQGN